MKNYRLVVREIDRNIFNDLIRGRKTVETRAGTTKFKNIVAGDSLTFVCGSDQLVKTIVNVEHFDSLETLFASVPIAAVFPDFTELSEARKVYYSFPGYEAKIKAHGIIAFKLS